MSEILADECRPCTKKYFYKRKNALIPKVIKNRLVWFSSYYIKYETYHGHLSYDQCREVEKLITINNSQQDIV